MPAEACPTTSPSPLDAGPTITELLADRERRVDENVAARILGLQPGTLANWRCTKRYAVPFIRAGRHIRYRVGDLIKWMESRTVRPMEATHGTI